MSQPSQTSPVQPLLPSPVRWTSWTAGAAAVLAVTGLAALAAPVYDGYFDGTRHQAVLVAAAVAGAGAAVVALAALSARGHGLRRAGLALLAVLSAVPVLILVLDPATHGVPTMSAVTGLADDLLRGWARMTTTGTPASPQPELLALPAGLAWLAAFTGVLMLRNPARRLLPALPAVAALCLGLVLTAAAGPPRWVLAGAVVALVVLLLMLRPGPVQTQLPAEPQSADAEEPGDEAVTLAAAAAGSTGLPIAAGMIGVLVLGLVAGASVAVVRALPAQAMRAPYDPRADVHPATELIDASSPMIGIKRQLKPPVRQLFTVRVVKSQLRSGFPPMIRVAALDNFDGSSWQVTGSYLRPGARIPGAPGLRRPLDVMLQVAVSSLTGPLLPVPQGRTSRLDLPDVRVDAAGTNAIATRAVRPGLTYNVSAVVAGGQEKDLATAAPDLTGDASGTTDLPDLPPEFAQLATKLTAGSTEPYRQLTSIRDWLRALPYGTDGPPGESYAVLEPVLFGPAGNGRNRPTSYAEQRVSAFAVLARSAGFPARVAVGYQLDPKKVSGGAIAVTSADVRAWAEVKLAGYGWVRFDPTDTSQTVDATPRDNQQLQQQQATGTSSDQSVIDPGLQPDDVKRTGGGGVAGVLWLLLVLVALVPLLLLFGGALKVMRRRRRRRTGDTREQVLGAWRECRDRLLEAGRPPTKAQTPRDAARELSRVPGGAGQPLLALAPLVDEAAFAAAEPAATAAAAAWASHDRLRRALDGAAPLWVRPLRRLNPRPLWHRPGNRNVLGSSAWPPGLRTPAPDATDDLAAILISEPAAGAGAEHPGGSDGSNAPAGSPEVTYDPETDRLIESMLAPAGAGASGRPAGGTGGSAAAADEVLVETSSRSTARTR